MKRKGFQNLPFMLPMIIGVIMCSYIPLFVAIRGSFRVFVGGIHGREIWGLRNYTQLLNDPEFIQAFYNTIVLMVMNILVTIPVALMIAAMINSTKRGQSLFKISYFLPNLTSVVVVITLMRFVFSSSDNGAMNMLLAFFGLGSQQWFTDPNVSKISLTAVSVWWGMGYYTLLFMAGLQVISAQYYEAASIDGASGFQKFIYITIPGVKGTTIFVLVMLVISGFQRFQDVFVLSGNGFGIDKNTQTAMMYIYTKVNMALWGGAAFPGLSMAAGTILGVAMFITVFILNRFTKFTGTQRLT